LAHHHNVWLISVPSRLLCSCRYRKHLPLLLRCRARTNTMLVTKALSQDVKFLAFVPSISLNTEESPSLYSNQLIYKLYVLINVITIFGDESLNFQVYNNKL